MLRLSFGLTALVIVAPMVLQKVRKVLTLHAGKHFNIE